MNRDETAVDFCCKPRESVIFGSESQHGFIAFWQRAKSMQRKNSPQITPEMAAHIKFLVKEQRLYQHQVAALVGVNQGRISEIMKGRTFANVPPSQGSFPF